MSFIVIGIDAGATKTVAYLADAGGNLLQKASAAGANLYASGEAGVERVMGEVLEAVTRGHDATLAAVCVGIAGVDRDDEVWAVRAIVRRIGCPAPVVVVNDALVALVAGAGDGAGVVIISGTGSMVYGRNASMEAARAGGWGHMIGDEGSGYWIGREALSAVARAADGRGPATRLTGEVREHFEIEDLASLRRIVYDREVPRVAVAALGPIVQRAADLDDHVALAILERAAGELTTAAESVARQLGMISTNFPFFLAGGVFPLVPYLGRALARRLLERIPECRVERLEREPAAGAVHLALAEARGELKLPTYVSGH
jgi:N-acetylglucosamine kinase-like BadF-type ATPase